MQSREGILHARQTGVWQDLQDRGRPFLNFAATQINLSCIGWHSSVPGAHAGCRRPWSREAVWDCAGKPVCARGSPEILYGWSRDGAALALPLGVGFSVGANTGIRQVVLQVRHVAHWPSNESISSVIAS